MEINEEVRMVDSDILKSLWTANRSGGWQVTQRTWEYFITIKMAGFKEDSVLIDIGGSTFTATVISDHIKQVVVVDKNIPFPSPNKNVTHLREYATYESLKRMIDEYMPTHISCISVFEHMEQEERRSLVQSMNDNFQGHTMLFTFEFHECFKNGLVLLPDTMSDMFAPLSNFYLADIHKTPMLSDTSFQDKTSQWFPLAMKFERI